MVSVRNILKEIKENNKKSHNIKDKISTKENLEVDSKIERLHAMSLYIF